MTNPTLERAARAVSEVMASAPARAMNNAEWIDFERKIARAVLMAVRSVELGLACDATAEHDTYWSYLADGNPSGPRETFAAIIDAILNDGEGE